VWVVVGLGNPGKQYEGTRHNVGFRVVDRLAMRWGVRVGRRAHAALLGEARPHDRRVLLVKPQTFMNASGETLASLRRFYDFAPGELAVVYDDVDLALGRVRVRLGGGAGGHRGVLSLLDRLDGGTFLRVKVGVGRPPMGIATADYVLAAPTADEQKVLAQGIDRAADAIELVITEGVAQAMNRINQREESHGGSPL
jgi:PTH1 family peptidyl-tRNA hydrolase